MILVIDNYDSFTYNLVQYLGKLGAEIRVERNDALSLAAIQQLAPSGIMLSPGPCTPAQSGVCLDISRWALSTDSAPPLFGVCLGHQALGQTAGGVVEQAARIMHGKASMVSHDGAGLFSGIRSPFRAIRYHSLVVRKDSPPPGFVVTARADDDSEIMGIRHEAKPIEGVQFHPESILTEFGLEIVANFLRMCDRPAPTPR